MCKGLVVYYESDPIMGVNVIYDVGGTRCYDSFSSLYLFHAWAASEFFKSELIEITDSNYGTLVEQGKI